ncbi:flavin reductase family protein [Bradyrhizobium canariense]|uniref:NADH-FMN oxidoreductase RutF, flavin reductase (DIM6/NTAB) family n=1 Tax=Bradyrhizobium canariense TaxID=255045 RepID=A0A1H1XNX9_9BRAD|nr:flavin reductase family protein [Bradyrhizobium canariense]SDT10910.1 NADH-FMN oxidoreductase RutF, flavin reductase (DIM6/NTAB) family [Bradyrhizobium canariense]
MVVARRVQDEELPTIDPVSFRQVASRWVTGVAIVTTVDVDGRPLGLTMNGLTSLSLSPPQFIVCMNNGSDTLLALKRSNVFCINFLNQDQRHLSKVFATKGGDKFSSVEWHAGKTGSPIFAGAIGFAELRLTELLAGGDHCIAIGEVVCADARDGEPLVFFNGSYGGVTM